MAQDHICRNEPDDENSLLRRNCEDGVGVVDVIEYESEDFINDHLISMLGAPDVVGDLDELFGVVSDTLDDVLGPALNPLQAPIAEIKEYAKDLIKEKIEEELHIDVDQLKTSSRRRRTGSACSRSRSSCPASARSSSTSSARHAHQLDALMHLPTDHHTDQQVTLPGVGTIPSTGLNDTAEFDTEQFAAYRNAVQTAKLLLLDGDGLNDGSATSCPRAGDIKGGVSTYGRRGPGEHDGRPALGLAAVAALDRLRPRLAHGRLPALLRSQERPARACSGAQPRPEELDGGNDKFPLWESCLLRPTFATLYRDWENGDAQFPALGDAPSPDPADPDAPTGYAAARRHDVHGGRHDLRRRQPLSSRSKSGRRGVHRQPDRRPVPLHQGGQHPGRLEGHRTRTGRSRSVPARATVPTRCSCARPTRATRSPSPTRCPVASALSSHGRASTRPRADDHDHQARAGGRAVRLRRLQLPSTSPWPTPARV